MQGAWDEEDLPEGLYGETYTPDSPWWENLTEEEFDAMIEEGNKKEFNSKRNIKRDKKGRLNQGAKLAQKDSCDEYKIKTYLRWGFSVKDIVGLLGCSKSVVYRVRKKYMENPDQWINEVPKLPKV